MAWIDILEATYGDENDVAFSADFPVERYGEAQFGAQDDSEASRQQLQDLADNWEVLWPKMRACLEKAVVDYKLGWRLSEYEFTATVAAVEEGCFMDDQADIHVRVDYEALPVFDFFIRGSDVAHFQPVF